MKANLESPAAAADRALGYKMLDWSDRALLVVLGVFPIGLAAAVAIFLNAKVSYGL